MSAETILLYVKGDSPDQWLPAFTEEYPGETVLWYEPGMDDAALETVGYAVVWAPDATLFSGLKAAKALFSLGAGVDHITQSDVALPDIPIIRYVNDDLTHRMSEWVVLQCLLHLRQHLAYEAQAKRHVWRTLDQPGADEVRVGIMGLGVLGQDAAAKLLAMGFQVSGWRRRPKQIAGVDCHAGPDALDGFLAQTDILVSLLPHTAATEGLVDTTLLGKLRRDGALGGPFYINGGRGRTQVDADIAAALTNGTLRGASLDVFATEPLPPDDPLWSAPNLVITPHAAAWSKRSNVVRYVMGQIERHRRGEPFEHEIDRQAGY